MLLFQVFLLLQIGFIVLKNSVFLDPFIPTLVPPIVMNEAFIMAIFIFCLDTLRLIDQGPVKTENTLACQIFNKISRLHIAKVYSTTYLPQIFSWTTLAWQALPYVPRFQQFGNRYGTECRDQFQPYISR